MNLAFRRPRYAKRNAGTVRVSILYHGRRDAMSARKGSPENAPYSRYLRTDGGNALTGRPSGENSRVGLPSESSSANRSEVRVSPSTSRVRPTAERRNSRGMPISAACRAVRKKNSFAPVAIPRRTRATAPNGTPSPLIVTGPRDSPVLNASVRLRTEASML